MAAAGGVPSGPLLDAEFLRKLERLSVTARQPFPGRMKGEKRSPKRGSSVEFADFREYATGDDLRYVDWKAFARLERLFVKLFVEEEDLSVHLLIDASQSMDFSGAPEAGRITKFDYARKVAAALGYVGLIRYDRVGVAGFAQTLGRRVPTLRGRASVPTMFSYLETLRPGGRTDFSHALQNYAQRAQSPGVCVVMSDFFDQNWEKGVRALLARRFQVALVQILDPDEVEPDLTGDLRLVDAETGEAREISVTPQLLARYREALNTFCGHLSDIAARYNMDYIRTTTDAPFEDLLLKTLRSSGLLK
jgi:Uncharacterized conserved protein (some members contain a von Willebrand factor type A (vWA) domain)